MAEPTLSLSYSDLQAEVGEYLGYGRTPGKWSDEQTAQVAACIASGLRQFYFPKPIGNQPIAHEWSFLKPTTTLTTSAPYSTGTVAVTASSTTVTLTSGTWPSWAAFGVIRINGSTTYSVLTRDSATVLTLDTAWAGDTGSLLTYELSQFVYDLPDDFGQLVGCLTYEPNIHRAAILQVGEGMIRELRQGSSGRSGYPARCATRPKAVTASLTAGQRWEILFDPAPDAAYVLTYRYTVLASKLTSTNAYAYGGAAHAEAILASCLAVAEDRYDDIKNGPKYQEFVERLAASIAFDTRSRPQHLGYNADHSDGEEYLPRRTNNVTYRGVSY